MEGAPADGIRSRLPGPLRDMPAAAWAALTVGLLLALMVALVVAVLILAVVVVVVELQYIIPLQHLM